MFAIVPVKTLANSKKRLASVLSAKERAKLSEVMLLDVLRAICDSRISKVIVVTKDRRVNKIANDFGALIVNEEKERGVNQAVALTDTMCVDCDASVVIPQDLPLVLPSDIDLLCSSAEGRRCVVITPSHRCDGTNALLRKPYNAIKTHYDEDSYEIHVRKARENKMPVKIFLNRRLMLDVDEPRDLAYVMKSKGASKTIQYLRGIRHKLKLSMNSEWRPSK
ncbi:MAG: 2-phospho-L-lactate guanylyltransferase [Nitrososphaerales archaeon]